MPIEGRGALTARKEQSRRMSKGKSIFYLTATIVFLVSAFTIFEFRVDGSLMGRLWQFVRGNQVDYEGLRITLPRYWLAFHRAGDLMLVHMAGDSSVKVIFMTTLLNDPGKWEQVRPIFGSSPEMKNSGRKDTSPQLF